VGAETGVERAEGVDMKALYKYLTAKRRAGWPTRNGMNDIPHLHFDMPQLTKMNTSKVHKPEPSKKVPIHMHEPVRRTRH
jgi:hypothetical protein